MKLIAISLNFTFNNVAQLDPTGMWHSNVVVATCSKWEIIGVEQHLRSWPMSKIMKRICLVFTSSCQGDHKLHFLWQEKGAKKAFLSTTWNDEIRFIMIHLSIEYMYGIQSLNQIYVTLKAKNINNFICHNYLHGRASETGEF